MIRTTSKSFAIVLAAAAAIFILPQIASACSCMMNFRSTVAEKFKETPVIAIFTVKSLERGKLRPDGPETVVSARLKVDKVYKGNISVDEEFDFSTSGICVRQFDDDSLDEKYLLFLDERPSAGEKWSASYCSRSRWLGNARADVLYLDKLSQVGGKTRLSGTVSQKQESSKDPLDYYYKNVAGLSVRIRGMGKDISLTTDEYGAYETYGLPAGRYEITLGKIENYTHSNARPETPSIVTIRRGKHKEENFFFDRDNSVSGKIVDKTGVPVGGACLSLIVPGDTSDKYYGSGGCADKNGEFSIDDIRPGSYVLIANKANDVTPREPFTTFYYPNKPDLKDASLLTIASDTHLNLVMTVPTDLKAVTINGTMKFSDGKPFGKGEVKFYKNVSSFEQVKDTYSDDSHIETDENGRFSIRILKGDKGILIGEFMAHMKVYGHCKEIRNLIDPDGHNTAWDILRTRPQIVDSTSHQGEVELVFPFASCKKRTFKPKILVLD